MPITDDATIPDDAILLRVLTKDWITIEQGRRRPTSHSFRDANAETSCFIDSQVARTALMKLFPGSSIAAFPAHVCRASGFAIERRPNEVPDDFVGDRQSHVVVGPPQASTRIVQTRMARALVKHEQVTIFVLGE
jgi:hypothetical protein